MTTWPDIVPTVELESPDAVNASANNTLDAPPRIGSSVRCAPSSDSMCVSPLPKKTVAATTSIATLIRPAIVIAISTSMRVYLYSVRASSSLRGTMRCCVSAECR